MMRRGCSYSMQADAADACSLDAAAGERRIRAIRSGEGGGGKEIKPLRLTASHIAAPQPQKMQGCNAAGLCTLIRRQYK